MSDALSTPALVGLGTDWRQGLLPGSFRGLPFLCRDVSNPAGQRLAKFEFPDSDQVQVQALGRGIKTWKLQIYVAGDDYMAQRDALEQALDQDGPGTLVHPYRGPLQVYAEYPCPIRETAEKGRAAFFECNFVEAGGPVQPTPSPDTSAIAFDAADDVLAQLSDAFAAGVYVFDGAFAFVQDATGLMFTAVQATIGTLLTAADAVLSVAQDLVTLAAVAYDDTAGYALALASLLQDYVAAVVTAATAAASPDLTAPPGYQDSSRLPALPADPSYGLAALAGGAVTLAPASATGQIAANAAALAQLVQGSATAALIQLYAQTSFTAAQDVDTARAQVYALVVAQIQAAAGNDALVQTWRAALAAIVTQLTQVAKQVPLVASFTSATPLPAVLLAQRLYQDGSQAATLVQRNAAPHPLFMPLTIEYLAPAA